MILTWPSPGKLNLFLYINGYRKDGYHELQTLIHFFNYGDKITISTRLDNKINILNKIPGVKNNIILCAAKLLQNYCHNVLKYTKALGADISCEKRLPIGGGLGGGSSNAATTLIALNEHWSTKVSDDVLAELGKTIGADIPFFVKGKSSFAEGIGDVLTPVFLKENWYLIINNKIKISTKEIFLDPLLDRDSPKQQLSTLLINPYTNDCENIVRKRFYKIDKLISWLLKYATFRLTGTGSCIFSEFKTRSDALNLLNHLPTWIKSFLVKGINKSSLHEFRSKITNII
ncbi:4-(cytidine 5'-diphospho)-2-C-methyl-D-erythritol kinase [Candidatus Providencia siddallii]|uniref:4-diphosphocytidyl-2-C-methyl-D-erythritol kinase n=1 Tax=Candidatus Providencia siddallii TaxID=1715285 RepID=A0ABP1CEB3_9GAMM